MEEKFGRALKKERRNNVDTNKIRGRQLWLDELRGIAMILVIFGHFCPEWSEYFVFTSPIKIPLFFAITGYCFISEMAMPYHGSGIYYEN